MPDGPPWVDTAEKKTPRGWLESDPPGPLFFHLELDENRLWQIDVQVNTVGAVVPRIIVEWYKPTFEGTSQFATNDTGNPIYPLQLNNLKFDNEDIFIRALWRPPGATQTYWAYPNTAPIYGTGNGPGGQCVMTFNTAPSTPASNTSVTIFLTETGPAGRALSERPEPIKATIFESKLP
jgi:hypothetical protein